MGDDLLHPHRPARLGVAVGGAPALVPMLDTPASGRRPPPGRGRRRILQRRSLHALLARVRCVLLQEVQDLRAVERASMLASSCTSCRGHRGESVGEGGQVAQDVASVGVAALQTPLYILENIAQ